MCLKMGDTHQMAEICVYVYIYIYIMYNIIGEYDGEAPIFKQSPKPSFRRGNPMSFKTQSSLLFVFETQAGLIETSLK